MKTKRILVTGSDGQLGKCLQDLSGKYSQFEFEFKSSGSLDITDKLQLKEVFNSGSFDFCINCAAYTRVEQAEKEPEKAFAVNAEGARLLAERCLEAGVVLLHISTDYVFDGEKEEGYLPSDLPNPINEYGRSKLQGEKYVQEILEHYLIIRTSWLYSEYGHNFYKMVLQKAKAGEQLSITDAQKGCPTNANNLAKYLLELIAFGNISFGIHHFTDGEVMSWYEFALRILKENGLAQEVRLEKADNYRTLAARPKNSVLKNS